MPITASKYINNSKLKTSYIALFNYKSAPRGKSNSQVDMYGLLLVSSEIEIPGDKILKFAWDGIVDGFEYSKTDSVNESLKLGLTEATRRVKQLITNDKEIGKYGVNINFTVFVSNNGGVYIGVLGESDIYVYKEGRIVDIFEMLNSKKAKTAAIAIEKGDLIFSSTRGFLKENLPKLISAKGVEEVSSVLNELGKEVGDDCGLVVFCKEPQQKIKQEEKVEIKSNIVKKPIPILEPSNSDYIPESKISKKVFKTNRHEKDLKEVFSPVFSRFSSLKTGVKGRTSKVFPFIKKSSKGFLSLGSKMWSKIKNGFSNRFGKKRWFKKFFARVSQSNLRKKRVEFKEFKIDGYKEKNQRGKRVKQFAFILLAIVLVVGGVKFTLDQKEAREISKSANTIFTSVDKLLKEANSNLGTDRDSAQMALFKAQKDLGEVPQPLREDDSKRLEDLNSQVLGLQDSLFKRERLSLSDGSIEKYYNTYTYNHDSKPQDIAIFRDSGGEEFLVITDQGTKSVYLRSLWNSEVETISDSNKLLSKPFKVYARPDSIFVLDLSSGILKSSYSNGTFQPFVKLSGLSIESMKATEIVEFAVLTLNENAYILDREKSSLLRSFNYDGGYSLVSPYLSRDEYIKANDVLADDLSIYITAQGENGIHRYVSGTGSMIDAPVTLTGLDSPVENALCGHTVDSLNKGLYIFDSGKKRVLRFEKPMESGEKRHPNELLLLNQYVYEEEGWNDVKDIVVDYDEKFLYMLDDTAIWKVRL